MKIKTYTVTAQRSGGWWAISIPEVPGAHGQVKRLDQVEDVARDLIALMLDVPEDSFDIALDPSVGDSVQQALDAAERARIEYEESERLYQETRTQAVSALRHGGYSVHDVGTLLHVSFQRASQLLRSALPEEEDNDQPRTFR